MSQQPIATSQAAASAGTFQSTDAKVAQNLSEFYKARDAIYEEVKR